MGTLIFFGEFLGFTPKNTYVYYTFRINKNEEKYFNSALLNFKYFRCTNQFIMIVQDSKTIFVRRYTRIEKEEMRVRENLSIC